MKKFLGGFLGFLVFPLFLFLVFTFSLSVTVFRAEFLKSELSKARAYENIQENIAEIMAAGANSKSGLREVHDPKTEKMVLIQSEIYKNSLDSEEIRYLSERLIDSSLAWVLGRSDYFSPLDLGDFKARFEVSAKNQTKEHYNALPDCTNKELAEGDFFVSCKIGGTSFEDIEVFLGDEAGQEMTDFVPDKISLDTLSGGDAASKRTYSNLTFLRGALSTVEWIFIVGVILIFALIPLIAFILAGCLERAPRVAGVVLSVFGSLGLIVSDLANRKIDGITLEYVAGLSQFPILSDVLFRPLMLNISSGFFNVSKLVFGGVILVGLLLYLGSVLFIHFEDKKLKKSGWSLSCK